jgi:predicted CDP-diglyceride synthetase/phosphatidate cytidylyltransferase
MEKIFYLAQVFNGLNTLGIVFLVLFAIVLIACIPIKYCNYDPEDEEWTILSKWIRRAWWVVAISCLFVIFVPEKKTFLFMVGGKAVDELVEHTDIEEIPGNTVNLLNEYIKAETENVKAKNHPSEKAE